MVRRLLVLLLALLVAAQVARNSAVDALAARSPVSASRIWPSHPDAELAQGMTDIGKAAHDRRPVAPAVFATIDDAAIKAPLAPEPFLVRGVQAELAGKTDVAAQAFLAAEWRDPRSLPAHYFLADLFYRQGDARRTLRQIAILARLAPHGVQSVAPYIAAYAQDRSSWPQLRALFRSDASLEDASLTALAANAGHADAVLALAGNVHPMERTDWAPKLVNTLVAAGQYAKARTVWSAMSQVKIPAGMTVYDAGFTDSKARPPFNWELISSTIGLAERQSGGRLHVIYYGHEDGVLARQMLLLAPGVYRMAMSVGGDAARLKSLSWSIRCDGTPRPLSSISLDSAASRQWVFAVPAQCAGQWLELSGTSSDVAQQSEFTIGNLKLERANG